MKEYYYNYLFPIALEYGMTSSEFWEDDPDLLMSYRTFYVNREKHEIENNNYDSWLMGIYNMQGFATVYSKAWSKNSKSEYYKKPIDLNLDKRKLTKEEEKEQNDKNYENQLVYLSSMKQRYIERIKRKENN